MADPFFGVDYASIPTIGSFPQTQHWRAGSFPPILPLSPSDLVRLHLQATGVV